MVQMGLETKLFFVVKVDSCYTSRLCKYVFEPTAELFLFNLWFLRATINAPTHETKRWVEDDDAWWTNWDKRNMNYVSFVLLLTCVKLVAKHITTKA